MITLQNDFLRMGIASKGAELRSLLTSEGKQLLWQADPDYWAKTSPVLFPVVGALKEGFYRYEHKKYELPRHGFARDMLFDADLITETSARFTLSSNEETKKAFPFEFIFRISYLLKENSLICSYTVENPATTPLYFSVGAHPAFLLGTTKEDFEECELRFPDDQELICSVLQKGLIHKATKKLKLRNGSLPLQYDLFNEDGTGNEINEKQRNPT